MNTMAKCDLTRALERHRIKIGNIGDLEVYDAIVKPEGMYLTGAHIGRRLTPIERDRIVTMLNKAEVCRTLALGDVREALEAISPQTINVDK